jgi:hypothetical protein
MMTAKLLMMIKCTLSADHFDDRGSPLVGYKVHCPMHHIQGYSSLEATGCCHWAITCSLLPQQPPGQQQTK